VKHLFIINPAAGGIKGRFDEIEREIRSVADDLGDPYEIYVTKAAMDACSKISEDAQTADKLHVYACGGDGTLNECANGAANRSNVAITHYPCGTGNDFLKTFGPENVYKFQDLRALTTGTVTPLDLIDCDGRYGINICSVGIDARVGADVHKYSSIPVIGGATGYVVALAANVIKGVGERFHITVGDLEVDKKITLACACNGRFYGGGFNPIPDAIPDDGLLDCLVIDAVSRFAVARIVGKYAKGRYREIGDRVKYLRASSMEIKGYGRFVVNIDGEAIYAESIYFRVVPKGVNFIFPAGMDYTSAD